MGSALREIETIVILMLENRSFDHMLGYLSLPPCNRADIDGLHEDPAWLDRFRNDWNGKLQRPFAMATRAIPDPPHEFDAIARQLGGPTILGGPHPMRGFIRSYLDRVPPPADPTLVMGYYGSSDVPMYDFFAQQFTVCDKWFASLPAGTQPNRLMAMCGDTLINRNEPLELLDQETVYDWLTKAGISWRVYHHGVPFFLLMPRWQDAIAEDIAKDGLDYPARFRRFDHFARDIAEDPALPKVIFVEPDYTDTPVAKMDPTDDHPPTAIDHGQRFVRDVYTALTNNPERWERTLLIVTYDEHGGFFDHVSPLYLPTDPLPPSTFAPFVTTGVRVPAFLISPYVGAGTVFHGALDHTSILSLLAERFDSKGVYSPSVDARRKNLASLSDALRLSTPRLDIPPAPLVPDVAPSMTAAIGSTLENLATDLNANAQAFLSVFEKLMVTDPIRTLRAFPFLRARRRPRSE